LYINSSTPWSPLIQETLTSSSSPTSATSFLSLLNLVFYLPFVCPANLVPLPGFRLVIPFFEGGIFFLANFIYLTGASQRPAVSCLPELPPRTLFLGPQFFLTSVSCPPCPPLFVPPRIVDPCGPVCGYPFFLRFFLSVHLHHFFFFCGNWQG